MGNGLKRARVAAESPVRNPGLTQASGALARSRSVESRERNRCSLETWLCARLSELGDKDKEEEGAEYDRGLLRLESLEGERGDFTKISAEPSLCDRQLSSGVGDKILKLPN